jgi:5-methylcytosine-specific restriction endonuclease McrA
MKTNHRRDDLLSLRAAGLKHCYSCDQEKPFSAFSKDKSRSDGFQPRCKACYSLYTAKRKDAPIVTDRYVGGRQICDVCRVDKPLSEYQPYKIPKGTYRASCNDCYAKHRAEWLAKDNARKKAWKIENPEWCLAYHAGWDLKNRGRRREYAHKSYRKHRDKILVRVKVHKLANYDQHISLRRAHYAKNRDKRRAEARLYYANNRDKERARYTRFVENNRETMRAIWSNRRAREKNAAGSYTAADIKRLHALQRGRCAACFKPLRGPYHIDHREALARGGSNDWTNLQLLHPRCNMKKHARDPIEYMQMEHGLLL